HRPEGRIRSSRHRVRSWPCHLPSCGWNIRERAARHIVISTSRFERNAMKKTLGALAAVVFALMLFAPPAEARCWWNGYRWHCSHHYGHHYWHARYWWHPYRSYGWYGPRYYHRPYYAY